VPEDIATRATLLLMGGPLLGLAVGNLVSWLCRRVQGDAPGPAWGFPSGLAAFGACLVWVVFDMAGVVLARSEHLVVQGEFLGFETRTLQQASRQVRRIDGAVPVVRFELPDGSVHELIGLSGSLTDLAPGDRLPVRVDPAKPAEAVIDDFQNAVAALWLFSTLAGLAVLSTLHAAAHVVQDAREARAARAARATPHAPGAPRPPRTVPQPPSGFVRWRAGARGQAARRRFRSAAIATLAIGLLAMMVQAESMNLLRVFGNTLLAVALAMLGFGATAALKPGTRPMLTFAGYAIGAIGFAAFGAMLWMLSQPTPLP
jgi:hypothetical protein